MANLEEKTVKTTYTNNSNPPLSNPASKRPSLIEKEILIAWLLKIEEATKNATIPHKIKII